MFSKESAVEIKREKFVRIKCEFKRAIMKELMSVVKRASVELNNMKQ